MKFIFKLCAILLCAYSQMAVSMGHQPAPQMRYSWVHIVDLLEKIEEGQSNEKTLNTFKSKELLKNRFNLYCVTMKLFDQISIGVSPHDRLAYLLIVLEAWKQVELQTRYIFMNEFDSHTNDSNLNILEDTIEAQIRPKMREIIECQAWQCFKIYHPYDDNLRILIGEDIEVAISELKKNVEKYLSKPKYEIDFSGGAESDNGLKAVIGTVSKLFQFGVFNSMLNRDIRDMQARLSIAIGENMEETQIQKILNSLPVPSSDDPIAGFFLKIVKKTVDSALNIFS